MMYQVNTKLQDSGWEIVSQHNSLAEARDKVHALKHGPLGSCAMYQIVDENSEVVADNPALQKIKKPITRCQHCKKKLRDLLHLPEISSIL
jgi:hypothetical protein